MPVIVRDPHWGVACRVVEKIRRYIRAGGDELDYVRINRNVLRPIKEMGLIKRKFFVKKLFVVDEFLIEMIVDDAVVVANYHLTDGSVVIYTGM